MKEQHKTCARSCRRKKNYAQEIAAVNLSKIYLRKKENM